MPHEDFFEDTSIEFSVWENGKEEVIKQYEKFEDLPIKIMGQIKGKNPSILLNEKKWKVIEINKDLRAHGKGMHVKVGLEREPDRD